MAKRRRVNFRTKSDRVSFFAKRKKKVTRTKNAGKK